MTTLRRPHTYAILTILTQSSLGVILHLESLDKSSMTSLFPSWPVLLRSIDENLSMQPDEKQTDERVYETSIKVSGDVLDRVTSPMWMS